MYAAANGVLGNIVKVTASSKVVGDLALMMVAQDVDPDAFAEDPRSFDIPDSVVRFLAGELGQPPAGWPEPFRTKALAGRAWKPVAADLAEEDQSSLLVARAMRRETLTRLLFKEPTESFGECRNRYGDLSVLSTLDYLYGLTSGHEHQVSLDAGAKTLLISLQSIGEPDSQGFRTVMTTINGQLRPVSVADRSISAHTPATEKADEMVPGHIGTPFQGTVLVTVSVGDHIRAGDPVATIEAMKMEAAITSPIAAGVVKRIVSTRTVPVDAGDLVVLVE